ncbi:MAG: hypothetical protein JSS78_01330 [Bacteroidetes bacterium]|nr:hypothetical protein [Bacteroidota bacterium]
MYKYFFSIILLLFPFFVFAQSDSTNGASDEVVKPDQHQFRVGVDISKPMLNLIFSTKFSYEFAIDYHVPKDLYLTLEGGWGGSNVDYADLGYNCRNSFVKVGVDKSMLPRLFPKDWDYLFVGVRYGIASITRSEARYMTTDPVWGQTTGVIPGKSITAHWAELTAGLRVELLRGFFAGYTVRGKFLISQSAFKELPPAFVAGYGKGDKPTVFDFNFYLQYALRWKR